MPIVQILLVRVASAPATPVPLLELTHDEIEALALVRVGLLPALTHPSAAILVDAHGHHGAFVRGAVVLTDDGGLEGEARQERTHMHGTIEHGITGVLYACPQPQEPALTHRTSKG